MNYPLTIDLDGQIDRKNSGVSYVGKATLIDPEKGLYNVLANIGGALCIVEVKITINEGEEK